METSDIIEFFDKHAKTWDEEMIRSDKIIGEILDCGEVTENKNILDVACGTGVLFPDYLARNVSSITGVDISNEMVKIAKNKFYDSKIEIICADVQQVIFNKKFDCIMIYNAFPHFFEPDRLFAYLSGYLHADGRITVAHGMSREKIDAHHKGSASKVSVGLMPADDLAKMMSEWFNVDTIISDDEKYIVSGKLI